MAKPLYVQAFEHFKNKNEDDPLKAFVAFGLYVEAERKWAESQPVWPTDGKYKNYHQCSLPHSSDHYDEGASKVLYEFVTDVVEQQQKEFLERAIKDYKAEAAKPHRKWWHGVLEATGGAILWSLILIGAAIIAGRLGVDVIGAFERAAAVQPHNMPQPKAQP